MRFLVYECTGPSVKDATGHPVATAAGLAALGVYEGEGVFEQARKLEDRFADAIHTMKGEPHVIDVRNFGMMGAVELAPREGAPGARGMEMHVRCFEEGLVLRNGMDNLQFAPFLNSTPDLFDKTFDIVRRVLRTID